MDDYKLVLDLTADDVADIKRCYNRGRMVGRAENILASILISAVAYTLGHYGTEWILERINKTAD